MVQHSGCSKDTFLVAWMLSIIAQAWHTCWRTCMAASMYSVTCSYPYGALHWEGCSCAAGMVLAGQSWAEAQAALAAGMAACLEALDPMRLEQGIAQPGGNIKGSQSQAPHLLPEAAVERLAAQLAYPTPVVPAPGPGHRWMGEQQTHSQDLLSSKVACLVDYLLSHKVLIQLSLFSKSPNAPHVKPGIMQRQAQHRALNAIAQRLAISSIVQAWLSITRKLLVSYASVTDTSFTGHVAMMLVASGGN